MNARHLPSRRILLLGLILVLIIGGTLWWIGGSEPIPVTAKATVSGSLIEKVEPDPGVELWSSPEAIAKALSKTQSFGEFKPATELIAHTQNDLRTIPDSQEAAQAYRNEFIAIWKDYIRLKEDPAAITLKAFETGETDGLARLTDTKRGLLAAIESYLVMKVPRGVVLEHLDLVNSLERLVILYASMEKVATEPVSGLQAAMEVLEEGPYLLSAFNGISAYLAEQATTITN